MRLGTEKAQGSLGFGLGCMCHSMNVNVVVNVIVNVVVKRCEAVWSGVKSFGGRSTRARGAEICMGSRAEGPVTGWISLPTCRRPRAGSFLCQPSFGFCA